VLSRKAALGDDITGLVELTLYGLKGAAAYAEHASRLGPLEDSVFADLHSTLNGITDPAADVPTLLGLALGVGKLNLGVMGQLEAGHLDTLGSPTPTEVPRDPQVGKAILVSGHDMVDLEALLKATEGTGENLATCRNHPLIFASRHQCLHPRRDAAGTLLSEPG
jgi:hydroxylamine reductase